MTNILIGVGGTGAKIVESVIVMAAAGLGPDELYIGLVDQDSSNGNIERTKALISNYRRFRDSWEGSSPENRIDWSVKGGKRFPLCKTRIHELFGDTSLWCPVVDHKDLKAIMGSNLDRDRQDLFDLLFMPGEEEQELSLNEGYRGRAHVGAAAMISCLSDERNALTSALKQAIVGQGDTPTVNIFLAGSAFGGTGAAGFPTIAREINRLREKNSRVSIGGALMLPYFGFDAPAESEKHRVVTPEELLPKARLALEYYDDLFESEGAFDRFYVIGWDRYFPLGYHEAGNKEQCNPPLLPELFAGSSALEFLNRTEPARKEKTAILASARHHDQVRWADLPDGEMIKDRLGQLFRFCAYWRYHVHDLLYEKKRFLSKGNWTHRLREGQHAPADVAGVARLEELAHKILHYAAALQERAEQSDWGTGLWQLLDFRDPAHEVTAVERVRLAERHGRATELFATLIRDHDGNPHGRGADDVFSELNLETGKDVKGDHSGIGRVVAATYQAVRLETGGANNGK
jgi:hypothetical protein